MQYSITKFGSTIVNQRIELLNSSSQLFFIKIQKPLAICKILSETEDFWDWQFITHNKGDQ